MKKKWIRGCPIPIHVLKKSVSNHEIDIFIDGDV